jgi:hypothetical protein
VNAIKFAEHAFDHGVIGSVRGDHVPERRGMRFLTDPVEGNPPTQEEDVSVPGEKFVDPVVVHLDL